MANPGDDINIVDDPVSGVASTATDTLFLLDPAGPDTPTIYRKPTDATDATLQAELRAYFGEGTQPKTCVVQGYGSGYELPELEDAIAMLPAGAGQVVAPRLTDEGDLIALAGVWSQGKVALLNSAPGASDDAVSALAQALIGDTDARGAALWRDYARHSSSGGGTVTLPFTLTVAALIAELDLGTSPTNPNLAAAGKRGISGDVLGFSDLASEDRRTSLYADQVNCAAVVGTSPRNYGFVGLADSVELEQWVQFQGVRTIMWIRAQVATINESFVFEEVDGQGILLNDWNTALRVPLATLYGINALFGATADDAYSVTTDASVNPLQNLQQGLITAQINVKTSRAAAHLVTNITHRAITATV